MILKGTLTEVSDHQSKHNEAKSRLILHSICTFQNERIEDAVIYANDTDVIIPYMYYTSTLLHELLDMWMLHHTIQLPLNPSDGK